MNHVEEFGKDNSRSSKPMTWTPAAWRFALVTAARAVACNYITNGKISKNYKHLDLRPGTAELRAQTFVMAGDIPPGTGSGKPHQYLPQFGEIVYHCICAQCRDRATRVTK